MALGDIVPVIKCIGMASSSALIRGFALISRRNKVTQYNSSNKLMLKSALYHREAINEIASAASRPALSGAASRLASMLS